MPAADDKLIALYERTHYRVRLPRGGHAVIRIHRPLPAALQALLPDPGATWAFLTAWNPYSQLLPADINRRRQRRLLARLRQMRPAPSCIAAGVGIGPVDADGRRWREPSLFVAGIDGGRIDALMHAFEQHAVVLGAANRPATLHWHP